MTVQDGLFRKGRKRKQDYASIVQHIMKPSRIFAHPAGLRLIEWGTVDMTPLGA
jgi:hypothetical protein